MRHRTFNKRLGRSFEHKIAMIRNLATSLFKHERIITTLQKAKLLKRRAERLITWAKRGDLSGIRLIEKFIKDKDILTKLVKNIALRYKDRKGGYIRIIKFKNRKGDNALIVIIELIDRVKKPKKEKKEKTTKEKVLEAAKGKT